MVVKGEILNDFPRFVSILIAEFAAGSAVNLALKMKGDMMMKGDMIIKNLDLKPTIDAMMRDFLEISLRSFAVLPRWKELNKETSSKILPCGDGSCVGSDPQTEFRGIAIAMFCANLMVRSQMRLPNIVPYGELNGVPVALVARFGVLSKSADRILVSHGGRKAHLLEDKQIPSVKVLALEWHLEEIHVTWAHLEKKRTRLRTYTKSLKESCSQSVETTSQA
ncbi:hypothetical protein Tco_1143625 [Tanacetum coccineum]